MLQSLVELKSTYRLLKSSASHFYGTLYISQSMSPEYLPMSCCCGRSSIGVYIKLVKHSTNKLRIVNVDSCKSGDKFNFSHIRECKLLGVGYFRVISFLECDTPSC